MSRSLPVAAMLVVAGALAAACAPQRALELPVPGDWHARVAALTGTDEWEFAGRMGVSAGDDGFNGKLWWRQDGIVFRARVSGPLGVGTLFINGDGNELTLTDRDGQVTELVDAEAELAARYGWTIPVTSLRYWALGIPDPNSPAETELNEEGLLAGLDQRDWRVVIDRYASHGGQPMPRRLTAEHDDVRLRLIIDDWTFR